MLAWTAVASGFAEAVVQRLGLVHEEVADLA